MRKHRERGALVASRRLVDASSAFQHLETFRSLSGDWFSPAFTHPLRCLVSSRRLVPLRASKGILEMPQKTADFPVFLGKCKPPMINTSKAALSFFVQHTSLRTQ